MKRPLSFDGAITERELGEITARARIDFGLTLVEAARRRHQHPHTIARWERGEMLSTVSNWINLLESYGVVVKFTHRHMGPPSTAWNGAGRTKSGT